MRRSLLALLLVAGAARAAQDQPVYVDLYVNEAAKDSILVRLRGDEVLAPVEEQTVINQVALPRQPGREVVVGQVFRRARDALDGESLGRKPPQDRQEVVGADHRMSSGLTSRFPAQPNSCTPLPASSVAPITVPPRTPPPANTTDIRRK